MYVNAIIPSTTAAARAPAFSLFKFFSSDEELYAYPC